MDGRSVCLYWSQVRKKETSKKQILAVRSPAFGRVVCGWHVITTCRRRKNEEETKEKREHYNYSITLNFRQQVSGGNSVAPNCLMFRYPLGNMSLFPPALCRTRASVYIWEDNIVRVHTGQKARAQIQDQVLNTFGCRFSSPRCHLTQFCNEYAVCEYYFSLLKR